MFMIKIRYDRNFYVESNVSNNSPSSPILTPPFLAFSVIIPYLHSTVYLTPHYLFLILELFQVLCSICYLTCMP